MHICYVNISQKKTTTNNYFRKKFLVCLYLKLNSDLFYFNYFVSITDFRHNITVQKEDTPTYDFDKRIYNPSSPDSPPSSPVQPVAPPRFRAIACMSFFLIICLN